MALVGTVSFLYPFASSALAAGDGLAVPGGGVEMVFLQVFARLLQLAIAAAVISLLVSMVQYFLKTDEDKGKIKLQLGYAVLALVSSGAILILIDSLISAMHAG